jgi:Ca-activated chloride channel homolog
MSSGLSIECRLARDYAMENVDDTLAYLLIKLTPNVPVQTRVLPINLNLVIDVSRSMKGDKINFAREAAKLLVSSLREDDWVSVITFSDYAKVVVPASQVTNRPLIFSLIDKIRIQNGTRMFLGMDAGVREIRKVEFVNKISRIILLTDGETEGEDQCRKIAEHERENHLVITTLGIGEKYNENLLSHISDATLGLFYHLKDPRQISDIMKKEFENASDSVITETKLSLNLGENVRLDSLDRIFPGCVRLQPRLEAGGKILVVDIGSIQREDTTILGAQLKLPSHSAGRWQIAEVSVNYKVPGLCIEDIAESSNIFVEYTGDQTLCKRVDREVTGYFNQISTQKLIEQAITETKQGNITGATRSLAQAQEITQRLGNLPLAETIKITKEELTKKGVISEEGVKTIKAGSRFTIKLDEDQTKKI